MKKFGIFLILCVIIILPVTVNAQTTDATKITGSFSVIKPDTQTVDVELTKGTKIDKGKGNFEFKITYKKKDLVGLFYELTRDSKSIAKNSLYSDQIGEKIGIIKTVPVEISGFTPGDYELKISDINNNSTEYVSKKFTVTAQGGTVQTPQVITADDYGLTMSIDSNEGINLKFSGNLVPTRDIPNAQLRVQYKQSSLPNYSVPLPIPLLGTGKEKVNLIKGQTYLYDYTIRSVSLGTNYKVRIVDITDYPYLELEETNHTTGGGMTTPNISTGGKITSASYGFPDNVSVIPDTTTATLDDVLSPVQDIPNAQLYVFFGTSADTLVQGERLTSSVLKKSIPIPFIYQFEDLKTGTTYFYKVRDIGRVLDITAVKSFKTSGTKSGTENPIDPKNPSIGGDPYVFDPNAQTGIFGNYSYPTDLSEPDSGSGGDRSYDGKPLVPCGKKSDQGGEDATCRFKHVIILFNNIINYMLVLMVPIIALISIYVGIMMIVKRQVPAELLALKDKFSRIGIGILVMFLAWVLVATLLKTLVNDESSAFILLDLVNF
jgi:hypothetical protein